MKRFIATIALMLVPVIAMAVDPLKDNQFFIGSIETKTDSTIYIYEKACTLDYPDNMGEPALALERSHYDDSLDVLCLAVSDRTLLFFDVFGNYRILSMDDIIYSGME
jgi:hypothetical protein